MASELHVDSVVRGHHIYKSIWTPDTSIATSIALSLKARSNDLCCSFLAVAIELHVSITRSTRAHNCGCGNSHAQAFNQTRRLIETRRLYCNQGVRPGVCLGRGVYLEAFIQSNTVCIKSLLKHAILFTLS